MGTVPIGIRIGLGSVETLLHITIEPIFICIGIGIGKGIGVGQWKHTIIPARLFHQFPSYSHFFYGILYTFL